jgi:flagellin-like hook-associated protein FlgL
MSDASKQGIIVSAEGGDIKLQSDSHIGFAASLALSANLNQTEATPVRFCNCISLELNTYLGAWLEWTLSATAAAVAEVADVAEKIEVKVTDTTIAGQNAQNVGIETGVRGSALTNSVQTQMAAAAANEFNLHGNEVNSVFNAAMANASQADGQSTTVSGEENVISSLRNLLAAELKDINSALTEIDTAFNSVTSKASQYVAGLNQVKGGLLTI